MQTSMMPGIVPGMMPNMPMQPGMGRGMVPMNPIISAEQKIMTLNQVMSTMPQLTREVVENLSDEDRRNTFGERIFQLISAINDPRVSKITGMMLELPVEDLLLIVNNAQELYNKICEANEVLDQANTA